MDISLPLWLLPILASALTLGFYDLAKKHAVNSNSVMPVLFLTTLSGTLFYLLIALATGNFFAYAACGGRDFWLILAKSALVGASWVCVYYAMRELPISLASPIRAAAPVWTFIGSLFLFHEIPTWIQGAAMAAIFGGYYIFSVLGKLEGFSFRHRGMILIFTGTILGASSALYDKYLLNSLEISRHTVQFWFAVDLAVLLGAVCLARLTLWKKSEYRFVWRASIPLTGILLIAADWLYFYAVSIPDTHISILSLVRRSSCVVTFAVGSWYFRDANRKRKAAALVLILLGVLLLAIGGK